MIETMYIYQYEDVYHKTYNPDPSKMKHDYCLVDKYGSNVKTFAEVLSQMGEMGYWYAGTYGVNEINNVMIFQRKQK